MKILTLIFLISLPSWSTGQCSTVFIEDFDGINTTNPVVLPNCDATPSRDYLGIVCDNGEGCPNEINDDYLYFGSDGQYFGVRDMDNVCNGSLEATVTFNGIDISACSANLYLCFDMAESQPNEGRELTGANPPTEDSWDGNSNVNFQVKIDECITQEVIAFESIDGSDSRPAVDLNCGGGNATGEELSDTWQTFCFQLTDLGTSLNLDININNLNTDGEDVAIDNITLICTADIACLPSSLTVSCSTTSSCNCDNGNNMFTGAIDNDWQNAGNWSENCIPISPYDGNISVMENINTVGLEEFEILGDLIIEEGAIFNHDENITFIVDGNIVIEAGGQLNNNNNTITCTGTLTNEGTYKGTGTYEGDFINNGTIQISDD